MPRVERRDRVARLDLNDRTCPVFSSKVMTAGHFAHGASVTQDDWD
jgi:hypothetical protein